MAWKFSGYPDNWGEISSAVKERDGYTCQRCGAKGKKIGGDAYLYCHHINSRSNDFDNLETVCEECHIKEHPHLLNNPDIRQRHLQRQNLLRMQKDGLTYIVRKISGEV